MWSMWEGVDVDLVWKCAGWASTLDGGLAAREELFLDAGKNEGVHEERRVPMTKSEFQSLCFLHDGGTFEAQCGQWHNMQEKLVDIHLEDMEDLILL